MFCRNCGKQLDDKAVVCLGCGVPAYCGTNYCLNCGGRLDGNQNVCLTCGTSAAPIKQKSKVAAGIFALLLGAYGVHNFYLGQYVEGAIKVTAFALAFIAYIGSFILSFTNFFTNIDLNTYNPTGPFDSVFSLSFIISILFFVIVFSIQIWSIVEGIFILIGKTKTDAKGIPLKN